MNKVMQPSGAQVRKLLEQSGLSREDFASLVHVSKLTVHKWVLPDDSPNHRGMPLAVWELALLKLDKHPTQKLVDA